SSAPSYGPWLVSSVTVSVPLLIVIRNWQPLFWSTGGHCVNIAGAALTLAVKESTLPLQLLPVGVIVSPSASATGAATSATDATTPIIIATRRTKQRLVPIMCPPLKRWPRVSISRSPAPSAAATLHQEWWGCKQPGLPGA